ncbi:MAG: hypothetical protein O2909_11985 [Chloroflexi bacterium]|nr:hypothetical protein [Chloroflexota bacterium]MDA1220139.1 hypothetical protein [Chloroflexota bacterium]
MQVFFKACRKCQGDLLPDGDEFRCFQCGNYYYPKIELPELESVFPGAAGVIDHLHPLPRKYIRSSRLSVACGRAEQRWWARNQGLIKLIDSGGTAVQLAKLTTVSARQIRAVREKLYELRAANGYDAAWDTQQAQAKFISGKGSDAAQGCKRRSNNVPQGR